MRDRYLARKGGLISTLLKAVASAPADERPALGQAANQLKQHIDAALTARLGGGGRAAGPPATRSTSRCPGARRCSAIAIR